jgi:hypothetical protein
LKIQSSAFNGTTCAEAAATQNNNPNKITFVIFFSKNQKPRRQAGFKLTSN